MNATTTPNTTTASNKELTQLREHQVWQLRIRCYSQCDIAEELGISQAAVSQILKRVRARVAAEFAAGAANALAEQNPCDENVKMIVGIDLDHMKYKNGDPVKRAEVDRLIALNNPR